jgi:hypothetical protein
MTTKPLLMLMMIAPLGCDALSVHNFAGTVITMTLQGAGVTPPGRHLELWARNQYDDIIRVNPYYDLAQRDAAYGLVIRQAIAADDPCVIDDGGHLLTSASAYPTSVTVAGVTQTPDEQAEQVRERIAQLNPPSAQPLLAVLPADPTPPPQVASDAMPGARKAACDRYRDAGPNTYVPNPAQITTPLHGNVYGFVLFVSQHPPVNYDGLRLDTPVNLDGVQELFFTVEGETVDPNQRGPLFLVSTLVRGGRGVVHYALSSPSNSGVAGTAALYVNLASDTGQF